MTLGSTIKQSLNALALPSPGKQESNNALVLADTFKEIVPDKRSEDAASHLYQMISSDAFATEVDALVGDPNEGESEEQYVQRARAQIKRLLLAKIED